MHLKTSADGTKTTVDAFLNTAKQKQENVWNLGKLTL